MAHDQQPDEDERLRDGKGRYTRSIESVRRDATAAELRSDRKSYQQIAEAVGYSDKGEAWRAAGEDRRCPGACHKADPLGGGAARRPVRVRPRSP
ncbi:hypothetical protein [Streptomyces anulatus]|uniref:hypothetical protein n=1 Tax=Streptomyces anulatus TaxID=1892 RepID=UPI0036B78161